MNVRRLVALIFAMVALGACGSDPKPVDAGGGSGSRDFGGLAFFGGNDEQCESPTLRNEQSDELKLETASGCLFNEIAEGRPVVVDIAVPTVEGDLIYHRFQYDGNRFLIVEDSRLDEFGRGSVSAQICDELAETTWLPDAINCEPIDHPGFPEAAG